MDEEEEEGSERAMEQEDGVDRCGASSSGILGREDVVALGCVSALKREKALLTEKRTHQRGGGEVSVELLWFSGGKYEEEHSRKRGTSGSTIVLCPRPVSLWTVAARSCRSKALVDLIQCSPSSTAATPVTPNSRS
ncbi:hypothetical protein R1flu_003268 [Riccia fluitans]|uniref:Uncharacterized protein n=1 Tax=Riccia fluitans TaxID=41844 RepID=A0ABD1Y8I6_9MARC